MAAGSETRVFELISLLNSKKKKRVLTSYLALWKLLSSQHVEREWALHEVEEMVEVDVLAHLLFYHVEGPVHDWIGDQVFETQRDRHLPILRQLDDTIETILHPLPLEELKEMSETHLLAEARAARLKIRFWIENYVQALDQIRFIMLDIQEEKWKNKYPGPITLEQLRQITIDSVGCFKAALMTDEILQSEDKLVWFDATILVYEEMCRILDITL